MKALRPGIIYCTIKMHYQTYIRFEIFLIRIDVGGSVIVILKRDDLPHEQPHGAVGPGTGAVKLSPEYIEHTELIMFVEGAAVRFLKQFREIRIRDSVEVLMEYIASSAPVPQARVPWSRPLPGFRRKRR